MNIDDLIKAQAKAILDKKSKDMAEARAAREHVRKTEDSLIESNKLAWKPIFDVLTSIREKASKAAGYSLSVQNGNLRITFNNLKHDDPMHPGCTIASNIDLNEYRASVNFCYMSPDIIKNPMSDNDIVRFTNIMISALVAEMPATLKLFVE